MPDDPNTADPFADADAILAKLNAIPNAVSAALDALGPPAPPASPAAPVAAAPAPTIRDARHAAFGSFNPFDRDPSALELTLMSASEQALVEQIRDGDAADNVYARANLRSQWEAEWAAGAADRAQRVDDYVASLARAKAARELDAAEARADAKHIAAEDIRRLGQGAGNLTGADLVAQAAETGALGMGEDALRGLGWDNRVQGALAAARSRLVPVEGSRVAGQGFVTVESDRGVLAYVPAGMDVDEFRLRYGLSGDTADERPRHSDNQRTHTGGA